MTVGTKGGRQIRKIVFRGKSYTDNAWHYGYYFYRFGTPFSAERYEILEGSGLGFNCPAESIGQYTGVKDANGKPIYEGDIVAYDDSDGGYEYQGCVKRAGLIAYGDFGFFIVGTVATTIDDLYIKDGRCEDVEVIGNVVDNPELLD